MKGVGLVGLLLAMVIGMTPWAQAKSVGRYPGDFNRGFLTQLQRPFSKTELDHRIGNKGLEIRPHHYHWDGRHGSYLNVDTQADHITHMTLLTPEGELIDLND